jgi:hypothetical protein
LTGVALTVEADESPDPLHVGFLRAACHSEPAETLAHDIDEPWRLLVER